MRKRKKIYKKIPLPDGSVADHQSTTTITKDYQHLPYKEVCKNIGCNNIIVASNEPFKPSMLICIKEQPLCSVCRPPTSKMYKLIETWPEVK